MKKFLCLILVLLLSISVFAACGSNKEIAEPNDTAVSTDETKTETTTQDTPEIGKTPVKAEPKGDTSSVKESPTQTEVIKPSESSEKNSSDFYLILNGTNEENISYHTGKCPLLKNKEIQKTSWEMIKMLEFRHCAKCNPPKYEGYVE